MNHALSALLLMLAISGAAMAGVDAHATITVNEETHTVDLVVGDDGSVTLLVDGEPVSPPAVPELPALP